jgi:NADPH:quinone reductase
MRRVLLREAGADPDLVVEDAAAPAASEGDVLVRILAAEVQPLDRQVAAGRLPFARPPLQPGMSAVGETAEGRVLVLGGALGLGTIRSGVFAEAVAVPPSHLVPLPDGAAVPPAAAGASSVISARLALFDHAQVRAGEHVLVLGATGAVGSAAAQIAAAAGATVLAAARRTEAVPSGSGIMALPLAAMAEAVADHTGGRGADVIVDCLGGPTFPSAVAAGGNRCRHVAVGYAAGPVTELRLPSLMVREHRLLGFNAHRTPIAGLREAAVRALDDLASGTVSVAPARSFPLDDVAAAYVHAGPGRALLHPSVDPRP